MAQPALVRADVPEKALSSELFQVTGASRHLVGLYQDGTTQTPGPGKERKELMNDERPTDETPSHRQRNAGTVGCLDPLLEKLAARDARSLFRSLCQQGMPMSVPPRLMACGTIGPHAFSGGTPIF